MGLVFTMGLVTVGHEGASMNLGAKRCCSELGKDECASSPYKKQGISYTGCYSDKCKEQWPLFIINTQFMILVLSILAVKIPFIFFCIYPGNLFRIKHLRRFMA